MAVYFDALQLSKEFLCRAPGEPEPVDFGQKQLTIKLSSTMIDDHARGQSAKLSSTVMRNGFEVNDSSWYK